MFYGENFNDLIFGVGIVFSWQERRSFKFFCQIWIWMGQGRCLSYIGDVVVLGCLLRTCFDFAWVRGEFAGIYSVCGMLVKFQ